MIEQTPAFHRYYARVLLGQARARYGSDFAAICLRGAMRARVAAHRQPSPQFDLFGRQG